MKRGGVLAQEARTMIEKSLLLQRCLTRPKSLSKTQIIALEKGKKEGACAP